MNPAFLRRVNLPTMVSISLSFQKLLYQPCSNTTSMETFLETVKTNQRSFIICKRGNVFIPVRTEDVFLIVHHSGVNFAIDKANNKYIVDKRLSEFEEILDEKRFFRVNRQAIVNIHFIKEFKSLSYGKILIQVKDSTWVKNDIVVSQGNARRFRAWIDNV